MAKSFNNQEGGTPKKYLLEKLEKVHNCYSDLKNQWEENAIENEDEMKKFICTSILIFLLGFLFSQVTMYLYRQPVINSDTEAIRPSNLTIIESNLEELIDYASSNNGARIIDEYSVPEYLGWLSLFSYNRKESIISDNNEPGSCWPFNGTYGYIGIQLAQPILPRHFSIYHINSIPYSTAPKRIRVYSLDDPFHTIMLATYYFDLSIKGEKRKKWGLFECEFHCEQLVENILLEVVENYGGPGTCVYQFRVHGIPNI